jgi:hypothetical protein
VKLDTATTEQPVDSSSQGPSRREFLQQTGAALGSALFGSLVALAAQEALTPPTTALTGSTAWHGQIHRASYIHETLGSFHHHGVFPEVSR